MSSSATDSPSKRVLRRSLRKMRSSFDVLRGKPADEALSQVVRVSMLPSYSDPFLLEAQGQQSMTTDTTLKAAALPCSQLRGLAARPAHLQSRALLLQFFPSRYPPFFAHHSAELQEVAARVPLPFPHGHHTGHTRAHQESSGRSSVAVCHASERYAPVQSVNPRTVADAHAWDQSLLRGYPDGATGHHRFVALSSVHEWR